MYIIDMIAILSNVCFAQVGVLIFDLLVCYDNLVKWFIGQVAHASGGRDGS